MRSSQIYVGSANQTVDQKMTIRLPVSTRIHLLSVCYELIGIILLNGVGWLQPEDTPWSPPIYIYLETRGNSADYILQSPILRRPSTQEPQRFDAPYVHRPLNLRLLANQAAVKTKRGRKATVYACDGSTFSPGWKEMRRCVFLLYEAKYF